MQGRLASGLGWMFCQGALGFPMVLITLGLGVLLTGLCHILCIVDAATYKPSSGKKVSSLLWVAMAINGGGLLLALLFWGAAISGA